MLAALFIALIGLAPTWYYLAFIDPSHCQKAACISVRAFSSPCTVDPAPLLNRAQWGPSPYVLFISSNLDKYSAGAAGCLRYHPDPHLFHNAPVISLSLSKDSWRLARD